MARRDRVNQIHHRFHAELFKFFRFFAQSFEVVPSVGSAGQIDAVLGNGLNHQPADALRNELEAAMQPAVIAQASFFDLFGAKPQPIPRIFFVLANEFFETQAQEKFHGIEARLVHVAQRGQHHAGGHAISPEADIAIAQSRIDDSDFVHGLIHLDVFI